MALDAQGRPIPVYTPPPPPPPDATPPNQPGPTHELENDVVWLTGQVDNFAGRIEILEQTMVPVPQMQTRIIALEALSESVAQMTTKYAIMEEMSKEWPKLLEQVSMLEGLVQKIETKLFVTQTQLDILERRLFAAWERGDVKSVPPA